VIFFTNGSIIPKTKTNASIKKASGKYSRAI
jgi:hypothetical protein